MHTSPKYQNNPKYEPNAVPPPEHWSSHGGAALRRALASSRRTGRLQVLLTPAIGALKYLSLYFQKVLIMIYLYSYFSGEASGSVCGMGGVKRKRADSGHLMEVDHIHHPGPQRPSKKWWPKILWFCYSNISRVSWFLDYHAIPLVVDFHAISHWFVVPKGSSVTFDW